MDTITLTVGSSAPKETYLEITPERTPKTRKKMKKKKSKKQQSKKFSHPKNGPLFRN